MTETKGDETKPSTIGEAGEMEIIRVPAWQVKYDWSEDPDEVVHLVCCRDLEWRTAMCGYEEPKTTIARDPRILCTMCLEVFGRMIGPGPCPIDDQPCPDDDTIDRLIDERTSRPE
jgi:hypothetical protein